MDLYELENIAKKEKITITNYKMNKTKAKIINYLGCHIFIDYSKIYSYIEEKSIFAEELGHYYYDGYYSINSNQQFIDRQEYKAKKWKALHLCSPKSLLDCFQKGLYNLYDIAEELKIEPDVVTFAYQYYINNNMLKICKQR